MSNLSLVVGGAPALAGALEATGRFSTVHAVESTGQLRDAISGGMLYGSKEQVVFLFADTLTVDTPQTPLDVLVHKLTASGWRVIVLALSPAATEIVTAYPAAGLLEGPFTVNATLGAIAGLGIARVEPVENGFDQFDLITGQGLKPAAPDADGPQEAQQAPAPAPWTTPAATPVEPAQHQSPQQQPQTPQPQPQTPAPQPQAPAPQQPQAPQQTERPKLSSLADAAAKAADQHAGANRPSGDGGPPGWNNPDQDLATPPAPQGWQPPGDNGQNGPSGWQTPTGAPVGDDAPSWQSGSQDAPATRGGLAVQHTLAPRRGWMMTVTSPKGGVGKSSLSLNLAAYLGLRLREVGKTVCLIDANFQQADTGKLLDQYSPNITHIVRDPSSIDRDRIAQYLIHRPDLNISALLGPSSPVDASPVYINARLYCQILEVLRELYDYVLVDTPVSELYHDLFSGFALPQADYLIIPVAPNLQTLMNADNWLRAITQPKHTGGAGVPEEKVGIVLNRAQEGIDCDPDDVRRELGSWTFIGSIPETRAWQLAANRNEIVAAKNYEELNTAFAHVLYAATGEEILLEGAHYLAPEDAGMFDKLKRMLRKG